MSSSQSQFKPVNRRSFLRGGMGVAALIVTGAGATAVLSSCAAPVSTPVPSGGGALSSLSGRYSSGLGLNLSFVEVMVAQERGFFKDVGLDLDIRGGQGTGPTIQSLLGNSVDFARTGAINAMIAQANEGAPLVTIATVRQQSQFNLCSLAESPVKHPRELAGKTVGIVSAGGATENLLDMMLIAAGVDRETVARPISGVGTAVYELAKNGQVDAWISVDTDRQTIHNELGKVHYFNTDEYAKVPSDSYHISQTLDDADSETPARFLAGVMLAIQYAADESNWSQVIKDLQVYTPDADPDLSLANMPLLVEGWTSAGLENILSLDETTWSKGQDLLVEAGFINKAIDVKGMINTSYLESARTLI